MIEILIVTFLTRFPALCPKEFWKVLSKHFNQGAIQTEGREEDILRMQTRYQVTSQRQDFFVNFVCEILKIHWFIIHQDM